MNEQRELLPPDSLCGSLIGALHSRPRLWKRDWRSEHHPLVAFYALGIVLLPVGVGLGATVLAALGARFVAHAGFHRMLGGTQSQWCRGGIKVDWRSLLVRPKRKPDALSIKINGKSVFLKEPDAHDMMIQSLGKLHFRAVTGLELPFLQ